MNQRFASSHSQYTAKACILHVEIIWLGLLSWYFFYGSEVLFRTYKTGETFSMSQVFLGTVYCLEWFIENTFNYFLYNGAHDNSSMLCDLVWNLEIALYCFLSRCIKCLWVSFLLLGCLFALCKNLLCVLMIVTVQQTQPLLPTLWILDKDVLVFDWLTSYQSQTSLFWMEQWFVLFNTELFLVFNVFCLR